MGLLLMKKNQTRETPARLLITMPWGIGDAVSVGLSAVDQVARDDVKGIVAVDVLCNTVQAEILDQDPRIDHLIQIDASLLPTAEPGTWRRGLFLPARTRELARFLRRQRYTAQLPFMFAPTFFYLLHTPIIFLNPMEGLDVIAKIHALGDTSISHIIRNIVNKFFAKYYGEMLPEPGPDEPIPLYICPEHVRAAMQTVANVKAQAIVPPAQSKLLLVAPDTSSVITRPPTSLLAAGIAEALKNDSSLIAAILPSYTDKESSTRLLQELAPSFARRVFLRQDEPKMPLLELAALIDQSDIFITGDTGVMHLAATYKKIPPSADQSLLPRNTVKIISLFGGTNPGLHGHSQRTNILGWGRKEQAKFTPGVAKDFCDPRGKNFFAHINPGQLTEAIIQSDAHK
jgi:hypothetical protein